MVVPTDTSTRPGGPRSASDAAFIERFDAVMRVPLIASALLPLVVAPQAGNWLSLVIGVVTWLVFLVDYVVHLRRLRHFGRTGFGRFDLLVVIVTAPWFLLPGAHAGGFVVLLRLARIARIVMASRGSRQLMQRLGRVAALALGVLVTASLVAYFAEHPSNPEFATVGDAFWWGIVTLTTVGYGDVVPKTPTGRWAGVVIMVTGIAVLGVLAGSLAGFFRLDTPSQDPATYEDASSAAPAPDQSATVMRTLLEEVAALRQQVALLSEQIVQLGATHGSHGSPGSTPTSPDDQRG